MSRKRVGIDIGSHAVHMAVWDGKTIKKLVTEPLPQGMIREGQILSYDAMGDFLKDVRKKHKIRPRRAALVLHGTQCFCRRFVTPAMTADQLRVNLPYEFRDFITQEKEKYHYDYAVVDTHRDEEGVPQELDLMAAATLKSTVDDCTEMLRRGGFKLDVAIPQELTYVNLLRQGGQEGHGHCILDLGHIALRVYMFSGDRFEAERALDYGCAALDEIIADALHVDPYIASTYREANHAEVQDLPACQELYGAMAVEVLKAINFYNFNNPEMTLEHIHCCGGGTSIAPLLQALRESLPLPLEGTEELLPGLPEELAGRAAYAVAAIGAAMQ